MFNSYVTNYQRVNPLIFGDQVAQFGSAFPLEMSEFPSKLGTPEFQVAINWVCLLSGAPKYIQISYIVGCDPRIFHKID